MLLRLPSFVCFNESFKAEGRVRRCCGERGRPGLGSVPGTAALARGPPLPVATLPREASSPPESPRRCRTLLDKEVQERSKRRRGFAPQEPAGRFRAPGLLIKPPRPAVAAALPAG